MQGALKFHPAAQILSWCFLVATMQALAEGALLITAGLILLCAVMVSSQKFFQLLRRTRWIMLSILLIYSYSTPGAPLLDTLGMVSPSVIPSREGLIDGVLQLIRLGATLASLAILLDRLQRLELISGLYTLFAPLQWFNNSRERLAVRLSLALHYAETAMLRGSQSWQDALRSVTNADSAQGAADNGQMALPCSRFAMPDVLLIASALLIFWLAV